MAFQTCLWVIWQLGAPSILFWWWYALPLDVQTKHEALCQFLRGNSLLFWTKKGKAKTIVYSGKKGHVFKSISVIFNQKIWNITIFAGGWKQLWSTLIIDFSSEVIKLKVTWDEAKLSTHPTVSFSPTVKEHMFPWEGSFLWEGQDSNALLVHRLTSRGVPMGEISGQDCPHTLPTIKIQRNF